MLNKFMVVIKPICSVETKRKTLSDTDLSSSFPSLQKFLLFYRHAAERSAYNNTLLHSMMGMRCTKNISPDFENATIH